MADPGLATTYERFRAVLRHARISPQKVRYVAETIRGQNVNRALEILQATPRRAARFLHKLLKSAIANAESITSDRNLDIDVEELRVELLMIDGATPLKRWRTAPQGRAVPILKRTSHMTMVLGPKPETEEKKRARKGKKERVPKPEKPEKEEKAEKAVAPPLPAGEAHHDHAHGPGADHAHPHGHAQHHEHVHRHESEHKHGGQHEQHRPPGEKKG